MILVEKQNILPDITALKRKLHVGRPEEEKILNSVVEHALPKLKPMYSFRKVAVNHGVIENWRLKSSYLDENIASAEGVLVVLCTLGKEASSVLTQYQKDNEMLNALYLDRFLSDTIENFASYLAEELFKSFYMGGSGYKLGKRLSPGYADIDLSFQKDLFAFFSDENLEIELNDKYYMEPEKSVSYIVPVFRGV